VLTGVRIDVSKIFGVGVLKRGAGAESESEKCDCAHLWFRDTVILSCWNLLQAGQLLVDEPGGLVAPSPMCPVLHELQRDGICRDRGTGERSFQTCQYCKFVDGSARLAVKVQEVDGIYSFLPSFLLLLFNSIVGRAHWGSDEGAIEGLAPFVPA